MKASWKNSQRCEELLAEQAAEKGSLYRGRRERKRTGQFATSPAAARECSVTNARPFVADFSGLESLERLLEDVDVIIFK